MLKKISFLLFCCFLHNQAFSQVIYINDNGKVKTDKSELFKSIKEPDISISPLPLKNVKLLNSLFYQRYELNRKYMLSLDNNKLLQNFYYEAGISKSGNITVNKDGNYQDFYWGWESPSNQLRGHFLGHWLSAAAYMYAETGDPVIKNKADQIIDELAICQKNNGGEWVGSIPEKYLYLMAKGEQIWSPQYTLHKTLMGLYDMYAKAGSKKALEIADKFADWFHKWTGEMIAKNNISAIYGGETSGMLEIWADLYEATHKQKYIDLMERYGNPQLFQSLMNGEDALTCEHANASIPWSHGAAKTYEVTGNSYWKELTLAFWKNAVTDRGYYCTGGQNAGEFWIPKNKLPQFMGKNNQEHCTVYNMIRTADYLYRWTGDVKYADYIERNIYNGLLAQQHPATGMVAYFLPMGSGYLKGGEKGWGNPTMDFYCCHGSLVQAQTRYLEYIYYQSNNGIIISQYIPSELQWEKDGTKVSLKQDFAAHKFSRDYSVNRWKMDIEVNSEKPVTFDLQLRLPWWLKEKAIIFVNGKQENVNTINGYFTIKREWNNDKISVEFPSEIYAEPLPDSKNVVAYMEGPVVLAGLCDNEVELQCNPKKPELVLSREYNQEYKEIRWTQSHYKTTGQKNNIRFVPLYEIGDEHYSIYFPLKSEK